MNQASTNTNANTNAPYGEQKKRMFVIDESDTPIMVNINDLMQAKHCGPKRAAYIYEHLPLIMWGLNTIGSDDSVMRSYGDNITQEIILANNRDLTDFDVRGVVLKHIRQKSGIIWDHYCYMKEKYNLTNMQATECCYEWWYKMLEEERDEMVGSSSL